MANYEPYVVRDSVIQDIGNKLPIALYKGASQTTYQRYQANSISTNSIVFDVNVPSENTIIDREVLLETNFDIGITITGVAAPAAEGDPAEVVFSYGESECLQAFPMNQNIQTATATINNCSITSNTQDIIAPLLQLCKDEEFRDLYCPTLRDRRFLNYPEMVLSDSNPLRNYRRSTVGGLLGRGAHPVFLSVSKNGGPEIVADDVAFADNTKVVFGDPAQNTFVFRLRAITYEPLMFLAPFLYGDSNKNKAGLYGVNKFGLNLTLDPTAKRMLSIATEGFNTQVSLNAINSAYLHFKFLTAQPSDLIVPKNVLPFFHFDRNITTLPQTGPFVISTITSNSIQFSSIPERIMICVRKPISQMTPKYSNSFLPIENISITFNNLSGILSGASQYDLFRISKRNGLQQEWLEFFGEATTEEGQALETIGGVLVLNPALDLNLPDYYANNSMGQFNLQFNLRFRNTYGEAFAPELLVISEYAGLLTTEGGFTQIERSVYNKDVVVSTTQSQQGLSYSYVKEDAKLTSSNSSNLLKNVPEVNSAMLTKSAVGAGVRSGAGVMSGGSYSRGVISGGGHYV